ncbi:MAG: cyclic nucleotide-binding/CBS domain-containing protein [Epsilonproteobacteria bacterium]|nr:cyclic nucleotide-binding/CBS domain-containing protein [Campylobacterota bacterium]
MSLHEQEEFLKSIHPFDLLSDDELQIAIKEINIAYYPKDTVLIDTQNIPEHFFIVIKGVVIEYKEDEQIREYHQKDCFDEDSLIYEKSDTVFKTESDLICYELSKKGFLTLFEKNKEFKNFFLLDLAEKLRLLREKESDNDISEFMTAKVSQAYLHAPCFADENDRLIEAIKRSIQHKSSSIIIQKDDDFGIITDSDIKKYFAEGDCDINIKVKEIAKFPLITIDEDDFLFNALFLFTKHIIKRVGVTKEGKLIGILEQIDLLSFFANQSHLVLVKIQKAKTVKELQKASLDYINIIKALNAKGVKIRYITKLISEINTKIFEKLFEMILPEHLKDECCLVVMGSEGRKEQIIRTDQDNALIIQDHMDKREFYPYMQDFTQKLIEFGYPKCDGNVMVSNEYWCKTKSEYEKEIHRWIEYPDMDDYMHFSIFFDSRAVAGDNSLIDSLKEMIFDTVNTNNDIYMAHFAKLTTLFDTPVGFFSTFLKSSKIIDIKKGGIFPIVQGVRSLCLKYKIKAYSTLGRVEELKKRGIIDEKFAQEIQEAFGALSTIRLRSQLEQIKNGKTPDNLIDPNDLSKIQKDLLKDSLQIVNNFKKFIIHHFSLEKIL